MMVEREMLTVGWGWGWGGDCDCVQVVNSDGIRDVDRQKY